MAAYVIFDVDIRDRAQYAEFMEGVKPALEAAGGRYLVRGGDHHVHEGAWMPRRLVLIEFPTMAAWQDFYTGETYQSLKAIRDGSSSARLVSVEGVPEAPSPPKPPTPEPTSRAKPPSAGAGDTGQGIAGDGDVKGQDQGQV
ncbi:DUF1330 domain-containing protein [Jannaschia sp. M317]|uniref:DUF1330 domain-containing protein n=1 Tax=Jannaschia sp. M317 TaxID=2867011 RepID=UPI0021A7AB44|nr:DUF1330 domain-containing protein [Jannaschia sp. M317]UWQ17663.1 DUF1330 domain-containing protein [Jannaschia sp. M317]